VASGESNVAMQWEALHDKLHEFSKEQSFNYARSEYHSDHEGDDEILTKNHDHEEFIKHRKQHYKEFEMLKKFRETHQSIDDDDEEEFPEVNNNHGV
jgi:hypothetical protein